MQQLAESGQSVATLPGDGNAISWPMLRLDRSRRGNLVEQIVSAITALVNTSELRTGTKMPSVRQFAKSNGISTFTVVESYDRLLTTGLLSSRRGSGYFVARCESPCARPALTQHALPVSIDALSPDLYTGVSDALPAGSGWLPPEWYGESTILDAVRHAMRIPTCRMRGYGNPLGFPSLRQHLASSLGDELFAVEPDQIVLTHGATHGFDLILRTLSKPGDCIFVEDPGYSNLLSLIRHHGCIAIGIPRGEHGLDFDALQEKATIHQPKLMFVNTVLQNPLGTSLSHAQAHRLLGLAERFDFWVVEDDIYRELSVRGDPSLAAMDGLRRVIRVGSFSKTLSPALRVGSIAASASLISELVRIKMLTGLTTSEINERAVLHAITARPYRRMLEHLIQQLATARERSMLSLQQAGMTPLAKPRGGMFISAGWQTPSTPGFNAQLIADQALKAGILLSPGEFFSITPADTVWFRFNVAYSHAEQLSTFLNTCHDLIGH
ncbi:PLP-dependent aminotransferase family protein [Undibacterium sp. Jales W-56]|uniref:aminotransferase-like domain-containing protein n=1 Tax=Undibacterium sp. Jales W-56 TaxID=2897325 RepID=UPI0021D353A0|nr:PLP-dependent aminotransferase family protein [Undibacterium sp. Jales W-56]MCU6432373.1 PLP-dependent aminotransferase family protein [Undibacterium sp. Jales W-56]